MKQTWYQGGDSKLGELWTILHLPYTMMCISFLGIGFGLSGTVRWGVFAATAVAYFLGLGVAAHAFDQLPNMGSNYVKHWKPYHLLIIGLCAIIVSVYIGIYIMATLGAYHLLWLIPIQTFFVWAYPNANFMFGRFHTDKWFAVSFGFLPVVIGYYLNTLSFDLWVIPWAMIGYFISLSQITLSRKSRELRKIPWAEGETPSVVHKIDHALIYICITAYLLAVGVLTTGAYI